MELKIFEDYDDLSRNTARFIQNFISRRPDSLISVAAGNSPAGIYACLREAYSRREVSFARCRFVGLDEWVGLGRNDEGSCQFFLYEHFFEPLEITGKNICYFNACASDPQAQCGLVDSYLQNNGPLDLMLLGLGLNGHLGLNEPGTPFNQYSHVVRLEQSTRRNGRKYFSGEVELREGITLGLKHILEAGTVILIAAGKDKAGIVKKLLESSPTPELPATVLHNRANTFFFLDQEAASSIV